MLLHDTPRQPTLGKTEICTIREGVFVLLDFASELQGGIDVTTNKVLGKGCYPTHYGIINIEHKKENGKTVSEIHTPEGVEIIK